MYVWADILLGNDEGSRYRRENLCALSESWWPGTAWPILRQAHGSRKGARTTAPRGVPVSTDM